MTLASSRSHTERAASCDGKFCHIRLFLQETGVESEAEASKTLARERGTLQRQLRGVTERMTLASSRLQVEDAASSLTALEQLYQKEQAQAVQSLHESKQRLARQLEVIQADRDKYKADSEEEHRELLEAAEAQQHLQEQIRCNHIPPVVGMTRILSAKLLNGALWPPC